MIFKFNTTSSWKTKLHLQDGFFFFTINTYILTRIHGLKKTSSLDKMSRHSTCLILTVLCFLKETRCNRLQPATQTHTTHTPAGPLCMISINRNVKYLSICFQAAETVSHSSSRSPDKSDALVDFLQRTKRKQQQGGLSNCNLWQTFQKWLENEMKWCVFWRLCRYHWLGTVSETLLGWNINSFQGNTLKKPQKTTTTAASRQAALTSAMLAAAVCIFLWGFQQQLAAVASCFGGW